MVEGEGRWGRLLSPADQITLYWLFSWFVGYQLKFIDLKYWGCYVGACLHIGIHCVLDFI